MEELRVEVGEEKLSVAGVHATLQEMLRQEESSGATTVRDLAEATGVSQEKIWAALAKVRGIATPPTPQAAETAVWIQAPRRRILPVKVRLAIAALCVCAVLGGIGLAVQPPSVATGTTTGPSMTTPASIGGVTVAGTTDSNSSALEEEIDANLLNGAKITFGSHEIVGRRVGGSASTDWLMDRLERLIDSDRSVAPLVDKTVGDAAVYQQLETTLRQKGVATGLWETHRVLVGFNGQADQTFNLPYSIVTDPTLTKMVDKYRSDEMQRLKSALNRISDASARKS